MKKGINASTFDAGLPIAEAARLAASAGFAAFEAVIGESGPLRIDADQATCRAAGEAIHAAGLEISGLACDLHWTCCYTSPDSKERMRAHELTAALLDRAWWMGAPVVVVVPGVVGGTHEKAPRARYADALARSAAALRRLWPEGEMRGVQIAIENTCSRFLLSPAEMRELVDQVNSPWVTACFDVGNVQHIGYPQDWIATLGRRISRVRVRDYKIGPADSDGDCPLGDGDVDWAEVTAALRNANYEGPVVYKGAGDPADVSSRMERVLGGA